MHGLRAAPDKALPRRFVKRPMSVVTLYCVIRPKGSHGDSYQGPQVYLLSPAALCITAPLPSSPAPPSESLQQVFGKLGFQVVVHSDLTADAIRRVLEDLGKKSFYKADVLVSINTFSICSLTRRRPGEAPFPDSSHRGEHLGTGGLNVQIMERCFVKFFVLDKLVTDLYLISVCCFG